MSLCTSIWTSYHQTICLTAVTFRRYSLFPEDASQLTLVILRLATLVGHYSNLSSKILLELKDKSTKK